MKNSKRLVSFILSIIILIYASVFVFAEGDIANASQASASSQDQIKNLQIDSLGASLYNLETGITLYSKNADLRMCPASTTKIMTALVVLENCEDPKAETLVVEDTSVIQYIIDDDGMNMNMISGEKFCIYDLLAGMMINSYCDAAEMLAYKYGGNSVENFVKMMNEKAESLGLENTHFMNPHGLQQNDHYSTPSDMSKIMAEAIKNPTFIELIKIRRYTIPKTNMSAPRQLQHTVSIYYNSGKYSKYYLDAYIGGKSGFTDEAGRCLVTYASKDGVSYILTLFGANLDSDKKYPESNMTWSETYSLLSYAYENFEIIKFLSANEVVKKLPVIDSDSLIDIISENDIMVLVRKDTKAEYEMPLPDSIEAEKVKNGLEVGRFSQIFDGKKSDISYPVVLKWDGSEIKVKSAIEKAGEEAVHNVKAIFSENKTFTVLVIVLIIVIAMIIPIIKILQYLREKENHKPKH